MRVPVRALALRLGPVRRVNVELHRQPLRDEMLLGEGAGHRNPVLGCHLPVGRQRQHDLTGDLGILPALGGFGRVPQLASPAEPLRRTLGQQHLVVLGRVAVPEVEHLARALGLDRLAGVVGGGPDGAPAGAAGDVAGTGELDGHGGSLNQPRCPRKPHRNAMHIASARFRSPRGSPVQNAGAASVRASNLLATRGVLLPLRPPSSRIATWPLVRNLRLTPARF